MCCLTDIPFSSLIGSSESSREWKEFLLLTGRPTTIFSANRVPPSFKQSLLLEMMAEAAGLILISRQPPEEAFKGREGFLLKMDRVLFFQIPREGDRMLITIEKTHSLGKLHRFSGEVRAGETLLVRGELTLWQDE